MSTNHCQTNADNQKLIQVSLPTQPQSPESILSTVVQKELSALNYPAAGNANDIYVPLNTMASAEATADSAAIVSAVPQVASPTGQAAMLDVDEGQQIIQQFQIQFPEQTQLVENGTQQIQIIQTDPSNPEQPQYITLYTWNGT